MFIDFHTHLGNSIFGFSQTPSQLIKKMKKNSVEKAVICPVKPFNYHFKEENNRISRTAQKYPDKLIPFCRIDPRQKDKGIKELERCINTLGMKGLFIHPWEETFAINDDFVFPLIDQARKLKIPVIISGGHVRVSRAWQISDLVSRFPEVNFIVTSGGQINISGIALFEAETMIKENLNVYMETSGIYREDFIEEIVKKYGKERVLFGSNSPEYDMSFEVKRVEWAHLNAEEIEFISYKNAKKFLNKLDLLR